MPRSDWISARENPPIHGVQCRADRYDHKQNECNEQEGQSRLETLEHESALWILYTPWLYLFRKIPAPSLSKGISQPCNIVFHKLVARYFQNILCATADGLFAFLYNLHMKDFLTHFFSHPLCNCLLQFLHIFCYAFISAEYGAARNEDSCACLYDFSGVAGFDPAIHFEPCF